MKQTKLMLRILVIMITVSILSCSPRPIQTTASWVNREKIKPPYKSVYIVVFTENMGMKTTLETDLAEAARARGLKVHKSIDDFGPISNVQKMPEKEAFIKKVIDDSCETIFAVALVDKKSETKYVPGSSAYMPYSYAGYGGVGMYGGFGGYYGYGMGISSPGYYGYGMGMSTPGYYETDKTYFIEAKFFDVKSEELLMSIQSIATNPTTIQKSSKQYTQTLVDEINDLGFNKKKK